MSDDNLKAAVAQAQEVLKPKNVTPPLSEKPSRAELTSYSIESDAKEATGPDKHEPAYSWEGGGYKKSYKPPIAENTAGILAAAKGLVEDPKYLKLEATKSTAEKEHGLGSKESIEAGVALGNYLEGFCSAKGVTSNGDITLVIRAVNFSNQEISRKELGMKWVKDERSFDFTDDGKDYTTMPNTDKDKGQPAKKPTTGRE